MNATPSPRFDRLRIRDGAEPEARAQETRHDAEAPPRPPAAHDDLTPHISVVIPMRNEEENVVPLYTELREVLSEGPYPWEAIFVDDGSNDQSVALLLGAAGGDPRVTVVQFARRFGQTAALDAGFRLARGRVLVPMDADQQNDPRDIGALVAALDEAPGYEVVSGWRKDRRDKFLSRRLPSLMANRLIARMTWTRIHDFGCTLKAYRREALEDIKIYGEMHRFLPAICQWRGARVTERVVNHRPRLRGTSKYGLRRTAKVMLDLVTVKFLGDYLTKPLYFFAKIGLACMSLALVSLTVAVAQKFGYLYSGPEGLSLNRNVLVLFSMMLFLVTVMILMMGVISELLVRIYHESQGRAPYRVRSITRCAPGAASRSDGRTDLLPFPVMEPFPHLAPSLRGAPRAADEKRAATTFPA
jgi:glycosyltransferase involved in cell wall biosynthesis